MVTVVSDTSAGWDALLTAVHVCKLAPSALRACDAHDWLSRLSAEERTEHASFKTEALRETYLASHVLCRAMLSRYAKAEPSTWRFAKGPFGKPTLVEPAEFKSLRFNLAHTDDLAICAVTRAGEVGVDVENTSRSVDASLVARHFLSSREEQRLADLPADQRAARFFELWVLKESYVKATGNGLAASPERLTIGVYDVDRLAGDDGCRCSVYRPDPSHVAAACVLPRDRAGSVSFEWLLDSDMDLRRP